MKKTYTKKKSTFATKVLSMLLAIICVFSVFVTMGDAPSGMEVSAASNGTNILALPMNIKAYPISTENNTPGFANKWAGSKSGTAYANDLCTIRKAYGDGWISVNYPISGGRTRTLDFKESSFFNDNTFQIASITKYAKAYRRSSGSATIGSVDARDTLVYIIGNAVNGRYQTVYKVTGQSYWKMGWVESSAVKLHSSTTTTAIIGGQSDTPKDGAFVRIRYAANGRYLDVPAEGATKNGTQLQIWDSASSNTNQYFQLIDTGKGWQILSLHSGKVVEVRDSSHKDCAQVAQWDKHNSACARWDIIQNSDGTVSFKNRESGLYLNVYGGGNAGNGTKLIQYHNDGTVAMRFYINNVSTCGYQTQASNISSGSVKSENDISLTSWHPLNGLTQTMLQQDDSLEALVDVPATLDAVNFVLSWVSSSKEVTRIHITKGTNGQMSIRYGTSIEQNRSGKKMSLAQMLTEAHRGEAAYVLWATGDADKCIRNWFGLSGSGKYSMEMTFGKIPLGEYGYYLLIENGTVYQVPIIHANSSYKVYRKLDGKTTYMFDAAQILRSTKLQLDDNAAAVVMRQLVKNGYIK